MSRINIEIEDELHKRAKLNALLQGKTLIIYIHDSLKAKIAKCEKEKGER